MDGTALAPIGLGRASRLGARARGLLLMSAGATGLLAYLALAVPVKVQRPPPVGLLFFCPLRVPPVAHSVAIRHAGFALVALAIVAGVDVLVVGAVLARRRHSAGSPSAPSLPWRQMVRSIGFQRVPRRALAAAALVSLVLVCAGVLEAAPLWMVALLGLAPFVPLALLEGVWKYEHYGAYALFVGIVVLQAGHLGEHTVQVTQLVATNGALDRSHGVFGQLDFETVHFFWDSAIWLSLCLLLRRFGRGNPWLWVAFAAASLHEVEHIYLYWLYRAHPAFYFHGGFEGIMGNDGVVGSPLARPYLHFAYNLIVVVPMVLALWDETKRVHWRERTALGV